MMERNPYKYSKAGYFLSQPDYRLTKAQKIVIAIFWLISLTIIGIKAYQYYFLLGLQNAPNKSSNFVTK